MELKLVFLVLFLTTLVRHIKCVPIKSVQFKPTIYENENLNASSQVGNDKDFEKRLNGFLEWYYEKHVKPSNHQHKQPLSERDPHDVMQSDEAGQTDGVTFDDENLKPQELSGLISLHPNLPSGPHLGTNVTGYDKYVRHRRDNQLVEDRDKETWLQLIRDNILRRTGRTNGTLLSNGEEKDISSLNITDYMKNIQIPTIIDDFVTEKIRSYYPSCELPKNTDQEVWNDETTMNLYFNVEHGTEENGIIIATATLRLYRLPQDNSTVASNLDTSCENNSSIPEEKLFRISIYWYTKSLKKHRVKRRLCDSKVVGETAKWVELSVRPATKAWSKGGKNLGLAVLVEDQDGSVLKADKYFKGASCTVGTSTPKPIPTVIVDAARRANELERTNGNAGRNATAALHNHISLLPTIDICTVEYLQNVNQEGDNTNSLTKCDLKKLKKPAENPAPLTTKNHPYSRHIRHQRQHLQEFADDPRSSFIGTKVVFTNEQLRNYNAKLAQSNFTIVNR